MSLGAIIVIALIVALFSVLPTWPHSREWGYGPTLLVGKWLFMAALFLELAAFLELAGA